MALFKSKKCVSLNDSIVDHYNVHYKFDQYKDILNKKIIEI
jgi:hypothetical protein